MELNQIGCVLIPSGVIDRDHPGHMSVCFVLQSGSIAYRGFRCFLSDLPKACIVPHAIRRFLALNRIPGYVMDDLSYADRYEEHPEEVLKEIGRASCRERVCLAG